MADWMSRRCLPLSIVTASVSWREYSKPARYGDEMPGVLSFELAISSSHASGNSTFSLRIFLCIHPLFSNSANVLEIRLANLNRSSSAGLYFKENTFLKETVWHLFGSLDMMEKGH